MLASNGISRWIARRKPFVNGMIQLIAHGSRVLKSGLFDGKWYLRQRPNLAGTKLPAICHFVWRGCIDDPSPDFCSQEYWHMNPDVARAQVPPILHYERYGRKVGRMASLLEIGDGPVFPAGATSFTVRFSTPTLQHRRSAVFASYSGNGRIEPYVLHYLKGLREVVDTIVFVTDNPLFEEEACKLEGVVTCMIVSRHGEYDFGSYKRGWDWLVETGLLADVEEVVFCNDSCYGPFHPFSHVFDEMNKRVCDFWGLTMYQIRNKETDELDLHFQSFFLAFRRRVFESSTFQSFMGSIRKLPEPTREYVVDFFEFNLTRILEEAGFVAASYIPRDLCLLLRAPPMYFGALIMDRYGMPLMKVKTFDGVGRGDSSRKVLKVAKRLNLELYHDLLPHYEKRLAAFKKNCESVVLPKLSIEGHQTSFSEKVELVRKRVQEGNKIRVSFLVPSEAMFPSRPLFTAMCGDPIFDARIVVIPKDNLSEALPDMTTCIDTLKKELPGATVLSSHTDDEVIPWLDISGDSDIVVYNSPYSNSHFFYNPLFSVGRNFLPIHVNYGYYRSIYDRHIMMTDNYAYFWKALFENEDTLEEYRQHSVLKGANALLTGYCKMDDYVKKLPRQTGWKCIMLAPHHSVEGGMNRILGLSNFQRYADLFLSLPKRYPGIDFIFRPHPALFRVLARENVWGEKKTHAWYEGMRSQPNVRWSEGTDYLQDFADSDAIIQDCGSFLVEYFYTGKPCCYLLKSPNDIKKKFTPFGADCLAYCYVAYDEKAILSFIDTTVVGGDDPLGESRERFSRERVMLNYPNASDVALDEIKKALISEECL